MKNSVVIAFVWSVCASWSCAPQEVACIPGRVLACACPGSTARGTQTCRADGSGYDRCIGCNTAGEIRFTDVTLEAGVAYHQQAPLDAPSNCIVKKVCPLNIITGGAAVGDYDRDGWPDLYVTRIDASPILFRNKGDGTFADVTEASGLARHGHTNGAAWIDVDNDGDLDIYVQVVGYDRNLLYINDGKGHFAEEGVARGIAQDDGDLKAGTSVAVGDYDRDGWLDMHVAEWSPKGSHDNGQVHAPTRQSHNRLFRNRGSDKPGYFEDTTVAAGAELDPLRFDKTYPSIFAYSTALADFDDDDWPELAVAADFTTSQFFWNNSGKFVESKATSGLGNDKFGMGSAIGDLDGDGRIDWFVTSISVDQGCVLGLCNSGEAGNHLYRNLGGRKFDDVLAEKWGIAKGHWAWGAEMVDCDNDGDLDLVQANGGDYPFTPPGDFYNRDPIRFWRNDRGKMTEMAEQVGMIDKRSGKGVVAFDYDKDGDVDVFVVNNAALPILYRNDTIAADWLRVRVLTKDGRDAVGAKISVKATQFASPQVSHVGIGSKFLSQSESIVHFGVGAGEDPILEVRVHWSDTGQDKVFTNVPRNTVLEVKP
jgi:hypothetical protein